MHDLVGLVFACLKYMQANSDASGHRDFACSYDLGVCTTLLVVFWFVYVCIDLWWASCVGGAMCYTITTCICLSPSPLVRPEDCDEGVSNIHTSLFSLVSMADACCYYVDSRGPVCYCLKVVAIEVRMKCRRCLKQRAVCETCLTLPLVDSLADAIEPGR